VLIFPPAWNWQTTQLHYLFTDECGGVVHCHAHINVLILCVETQQTATFWGVGLIPTFELGQDFCTMHLTAKLHHATFNRSGSYHADKQTDAAENIHLAPLCYASK